VICLIFSSHIAVFANKRLNSGETLEMQRHIHYGSGGAALMARRTGVKTGEFRGYTPVGWPGSFRLVKTVSCREDARVCVCVCMCMCE
jgi:hypothetical protein